MVRRRVFGGAGGLWFRKKRKKDTDTPTSTIVGDGGATTDGVAAAASFHAQGKEAANNDNVELTKLIEWDTVRCRPATNDCSTASSSSPSSSSSSSDDEGGEDIGFDSNINNYHDDDDEVNGEDQTPTHLGRFNSGQPRLSLLSSAYSVDTASPAFPITDRSLWAEAGEKNTRDEGCSNGGGAATTAAGVGQKKRGAFGGLRKRGVTPFDDETPEPPKWTSKRIRMDEPMATAATNDEGIITTNGGNAEEATTSKRQQQPVATESILRRPNCNNKKKNDGLAEIIITASTSSSETTDFEFQDEEEEEVETKTPKIASSQQLSALTSLSVARKFFQKLDTNHPLAVDDRETPSSPPPAARGFAAIKNGRTRRVLGLDNPVISQEYQQYQVACKDADVAPLLLESFLQQRRLFHTAVYDGILDD